MANRDEGLPLFDHCYEKTSSPPLLFAHAEEASSSVIDHEHRQIQQRGMRHSRPLLLSPR
jgi:hypothetical protein